MINREKVAVMTQEALYEKKNRLHVFPATNFYMFDYVSFQVLKGVLAGTLFYMILAAGWMIYTMDEWITTYSLKQMIAMLQKLGIVYLIAMAALIIILALNYSLRYIHSKELLKAERSNLKRLERFYKLESKERGE